MSVFYYHKEKINIETMESDHFGAVSKRNQNKLRFLNKIQCQCHGQSRNATEDNKTSKI